MSASLTGSAASVAAPESLHTVKESSVSASVTTDNGGVLAAGQDLAASVTVTNPTDTAIAAGTVELWLDPQPQASRGALSSWLSSTEPVSGRSVLGSAALALLEPGSSSVVRVTVPAAAVPFVGRSTSAVFGIGATVITSGQVEADTRGTVVWSAGDASTRTNISVVMPIVSPSSGNGLISATDLATYTAPNGVLTRDLDGLTSHSTVTVGIDPMIVASIRALGNAAPASAVAWLARLKTLSNNTFSLSYGDADLTGQLQAGLSTPLSPTSLDFALDAKNFSPTPTTLSQPSTNEPAVTPSPNPTPGDGTALPSLDQLLAWSYSLPGIAWPGDKTVRSSDIPQLAAAGFPTTIVSGDNTNADQQEKTPNAPIRTGSSTLAVSDQRLSDALRQAVSAPSEVVWSTAMSKANAQLQLISAEGSSPRQVLIALDRSWPSSGTQLARTLDALFVSSWTTPATFSSMLTAAPSSGTALVDAPESESRLDSIRSLLADETALTGFSSVLADPSSLTGSTRAQLLTLLAVSWQNARTSWATAVAKSRAATSKTLQSIRILPTENINLVSAQGSIPFTVSNGLRTEAVTVVLNASPSNGRLEIDQSVTKTIPQDSRATMLVPVKAEVGNGQVVLSLQLYSPTGVPIGEPTAVRVEVHADWEGIGALVFGILLVLLFGFGIVRGILRRREKGDGSDETETGEDSDESEAKEPSEPSLAQEKGGTTGRNSRG